jgi:hypothetical protein
MQMRKFDPAAGDLPDLLVLSEWELWLRGGRKIVMAHGVEKFRKIFADNTNSCSCGNCLDCSTRQILDECGHAERNAVGPYVPILLARFHERPVFWDKVAEHMGRLYSGLR